MRQSEQVRNTTETQISVSLCLDSRKKGEIITPVGFLTHMLELFQNHSGFEVHIRAQGDIHVDFHHTVEDIGILLGQAFSQALGDKRGICRYADILLPMDEALVLAAVDISGRAYLAYDVSFPSSHTGNFDLELVEEFLYAFVTNAKITLHIQKLAGTNAHHIAEAVFKALARVLRQAVKIDGDNADVIPSTKGVL